MAQRDNLLQLSQTLSAAMVKKNLKRWFPVNGDKDAHFFIKTKYKKKEKKSEPNSYSDDNLKYFCKDFINQFQERNHSILWLCTVQHQILERPICLSGQWPSLCLFKIYLKCLLSHSLPQEFPGKTDNSLIELVQDSVHSLNFTKLKVEDIYQWLDVKFNSNCLGIKVIEQDSDNGIASTSNMMFGLKSDILSAIDFAMTLYCKIHNIKSLDVSKDNANPYKKKMFTMKESETNSFSSNNLDSSEKLSIFNSDDIMKLKKHTEKESSRIKYFHNKHILIDSENLKNTSNRDDLIVPTGNILTLSETKQIKPLCQSKNDADSYVKQFKEHLVANDVTFPLVKFNLDYEEISGSSEMFLSTIITHKSQNVYNDAVLTICANKPCISEVDVMKKNCVSKKVSDFSDSNIMQEDSKESQDTIVNCKNTHSSSQKFTKSHFSETPIFHVEDHKELLFQESGNQNVPGAVAHVSENEEIEHVVPNINSIANQSMVETFMYEESINSKGLTSPDCQMNMKSSESTSELEEKSIKAFHWCNRSLKLANTDVSVSDQCSYPSVQQCNRPLRLGLSKKQRVKQLHKK